MPAIELYYEFEKNTMGWMPATEARRFRILVDALFSYIRWTTTTCEGTSV